MKVGLIYMGCLLLLPFFATASDLPASNQSKEMTQIEVRIKRLRSQLESDRKIEAREEVRSQGDSIADWKKYAKDLENVRKLNDKDKELLSEIRALEEKKAKLIEEEKEKTVKAK